MKKLALFTFGLLVAFLFSWGQVNAQQSVAGNALPKGMVFQVENLNSVSNSYDININTLNLGSRSQAERLFSKVSDDFCSFSVDFDNQKVTANLDWANKGWVDRSTQGVNKYFTYVTHRINYFMNE